MNGSRANPNVKKDIFQDYDIVYVVTETESFIETEGWISIFGEPIIIQEPDKLDKMLGRNVDFFRRLRLKWVNYLVMIIIMMKQKEA